MMMASNLTIWRTVLFAVFPIIVILILNLTIAIAYGQTSGAPQNYVIRRVEIWGLFYRGMVAAFIVGALVQGCTVYVAWRFRESNKKTHPSREPPKDSLR
jgi:heme/copper-type cytochrome/quinol oxidase subunit 2